MKIGLDIRMRECVKTKLRPPAIWSFLSGWADEVTALLVANEELHKQNAELIMELNARMAPDHETRFGHAELPF